MNHQRMLVVVLLAFLSISYEVKEATAASFPWTCSSFSGVCRPMCLPSEMHFGPFGCAKGFLCCVSHFV
ncbi:hypothetical protein MATL_G00042630 [Megalops atlanticus]|uniref:Beta-defensin n=1 Tax=Megalops atlanticus TaxID=7932 RepID=A0A9D3TID0_MEGAT|nr:hypothetical protein MATL_G00042630 [Megalops atlanticus]